MATFAPLILILLPSLALSALHGDHTYKLTVHDGQIPWDFNLLDNHHPSPIDIRMKNEEDVWLEDNNPLVFKATHDPSMKYIVRNSGHGVEVVTDPSELAIRGSVVRPILFGGILRDIYIFQNVHYHWGTLDREGSEHTINGKSFSLEGHVVTFKQSYGTFEKAVKEKDGIVVFTFFAQADDQNPDNPDLAKFLAYFPAVAQYGSGNIPLTGTDAFLWFLPKIGELNVDYIAYPGSLTTPDYAETVTFIIVTNPVPISCKQLARFRHIVDKHNHELNLNKREQQALQNRPIIFVRNNFRVDYGANYYMSEHGNDYTSLNPYAEGYQNDETIFGGGSYM